MRRNSKEFRKHLKRIGFQRGSKHTEEEINNLREINLGEKNPMFGKSSWNKGLPTSMQPMYNKENKWGKHSELTKQNLREINLGKHLSKETIELLRVIRIGNKYAIGSKGMLGKHHTEKTKQILRLKLREYVKNNGAFFNVNIGRNETQILDEVELTLNKKIIRQFQILRYFVDGYCKELNLVIEVDETSKTSEKDILREKEIVKMLNCNFIRIPDYIDCNVGGNK